MISVILMVALTITLEAIVVSFAMGHAKHHGKTKNQGNRGIKKNEFHGALVLIKGTEGTSFKVLNVTMRS